MKMVLILDSVECCDDCPCSEFVWYDEENYIGVWECKNTHMDEEHKHEKGNEGRPDWCKLRPLPERRDTVSIFVAKREAEENHVTVQHQAGFNLGWNACLDAIEGVE